MEVQEEWGGGRLKDSEAKKEEEEEDGKWGRGVLLRTE